MYGAVSPDYWADWQTGAKSYRRYERLYQFHSRLQTAVERDGFQNPILIWDFDAQIRVPYGRSRAYVARMLRIDVPAFVCDVRRSPCWDGFEEITGVEQALTKFTDPPAVLEFCDRLFHFWGCQQTHLDRRHRAIFDRRQQRYNAGRLLRPQVRRERIAWFYRDEPE